MDNFLRINLLDWREARREQRKQKFTTALVAAALFSAGIIALVWFCYGNAIDNQEARNRFLKDQIVQVDKQIKEIQELEEVRDSLITRMRIIEQLQQSRAQIVHYFEQVATTLPDGVHLASLKQADQSTTINGVAESNGRVSTYMVNLEQSKWFDDPRLVVIKTVSQERRRAADFTLTFKSITPNGEDDAAFETSQDSPEYADPQATP